MASITALLKIPPSQPRVAHALDFPDVRRDFLHRGFAMAAGAHACAVDLAKTSPVQAMPAECAADLCEFHGARDLPLFLSPAKPGGNGMRNMVNVGAPKCPNPAKDRAKAPGSGSLCGCTQATVSKIYRPPWPDSRPRRLIGELGTPVDSAPFQHRVEQRPQAPEVGSAAEAEVPGCRSTPPFRQSRLVARPRRGMTRA